MTQFGTKLLKAMDMTGKKFTEDEPQSSGLGKIPFIVLLFLSLYFSLFIS